MNNTILLLKNINFENVDILGLALVLLLIAYNITSRVKLEKKEIFIVWGVAIAIFLIAIYLKYYHQAKPTEKIKTEEVKKPILPINYKDSLEVLLKSYIKYDRIEEKEEIDAYFEKNSIVFFRHKNSDVRTEFQYNIALDLLKRNKFDFYISDTFIDRPIRKPIEIVFPSKIESNNPKVDIATGDRNAQAIGKAASITIDLFQSYINKITTGNDFIDKACSLCDEYRCIIQKCDKTKVNCSEPPVREYLTRLYDNHKKITIKQLRKPIVSQVVKLNEKEYDNYYVYGKFYQLSINEETGRIDETIKSFKIKATLTEDGTYNIQILDVNVEEVIIKKEGKK